MRDRIAGSTGLSVVIAVARERILEAHVVHALDFIGKTEGELLPPRALAIYARLHHLGEEELRVVRNRVIASWAGGATDRASGPATFIAINGDVDWDVTVSVLGRLRRRLGGRRNLRLRRWVELHAGHVEAELLALHTDHAVRVMDAMKPRPDTYGGVRAYAEAVGVRPALVEALSIRVAARLYEDGGPLHTVTVPDEADAPAAAITPPVAPEPLRLVSGQT
jgi:hypothetical protein